MDIRDYLQGCLRTWDCSKYRLTRAILGLVGEAGEVAEKYKKYLRGDYEATRQEINEVTKDAYINFTFIENIAEEIEENKKDQAIMKELGDVIYYWTMLCYELGFDPAKVMEANLEKLADRQARGKIRGCGDER